jgi:hypothetical protein
MAFSSVLDFGGLAEHRGGRLAEEEGVASADMVMLEQKVLELVV